MAVEIERKFIVNDGSWRRGDGVRISQGYLSRDKERTVRVRLAGVRAFLTIKGVTTGATRAEFEYEIPAADGKQLLKLCNGPVIEKIRRIVAENGSVWEVDEFLGDNAGLIVAEIELSSENQVFTKPEWLGQEVTHDTRYFNSRLVERPYGTWHKGGSSGQ